MSAVIVGAKGYQIESASDFEETVSELAMLEPGDFVLGVNLFGYNGERVAIRASQIIAVVES